jgi:hypothetical protein
MCRSRSAVKIVNVLDRTHCYNGKIPNNKNILDVKNCVRSRGLWNYVYRRHVENHITLKVATPMGETCRWLLCNKITFNKSAFMNRSSLVGSFQKILYDNIFFILRILFWLRKIRVTRVADGKHQLLCRHDWHFSICSAVEPSLVSRSRRSLC